ncbi:hypothetical protein P280DRAFT_391816 [Massarina eburnea CBS 473.64]|uniref:F-box domain-containing protein n=1 Tax=Massarina eburnea CBS 473.64 TaxID=1395130 RepID=A0A6A6S9C1_9PLEO|nr:hypothetical protein P280DRAFT_391816 [Massarina eburnea CBS 473.64]
MLNANDFPPLPSQRARRRTGAQGRAHTSVRARVNGVAASINDLPDELWIEILDYVPALDLKDFQLPTLANLSRVNKRINSLVIERLYAGYNSFFCEPYLFLRTVMAKPWLAENVRSMQISYGPRVHEDRKRYTPSVTDRRTIKDSLKAMDIPGWKAWATDCNDDEVERELLYATILMYTPNITELIIDDGELSYRIPKWLDILRWTVSGGRLGHVHRFLQLKTLRIDIGYLKLRHLAPIFKLPGLNTVSLTGLVDIGRVERGKPDALRRLLPIGTCLVENFSVHKAFVDDRILDVLLQCFRSLKHFEFSHTDELYPEDRDARERTSFSNLNRSLGRHRLTLVGLSLHDIIIDNYYHKSPGLMGDLSQFKKLTHLEISSNTLVHVHDSSPTISAENLPPSITSLVVFLTTDEREHNCLEALIHLASQSRHVLPLLKEVRIEVEDRFAKLKKYDWERLRRLWADVDVALVVKIEDEDEDDGDDDEDFVWHGSVRNDVDEDTESEVESDEESLYSS